MRGKLLALTTVLGLIPAGALADEGKNEGGSATTAVAPLQSREIIERLKTMRAQLLLDQEYNRLLEARLKRLELEDKLGLDTPVTKKRSDDVPRPPPRVVTSAPPQVDGSGIKDLVVKSVTTSPFKEAFVVYKGRVYTVRPGDQMGDLTIRDVTDNGVVTNRATVNME